MSKNIVKIEYGLIPPRAMQLYSTPTRKKVCYAESFLILLASNQEHYAGICILSIHMQCN